MIPQSESVRSRLVLQEWERRGPDTDPALKGMVIEEGVARQTVTALRERRMLMVTELRSGLELRSTSHVGQIRIGSLDVTIRPKIGWHGLLKLARYAYGLRSTEVGPHLQVALDQDSLVDLLILQLCVEARAIAARGRHRNYQVKRSILPVPRGRLDVPRLALQEISATSGLPCIVRPRSEDILLNRVLFAGLRLGARMAAAPQVRGEALRAAALWADSVSDTGLSGRLVQRVIRGLNRMTENYRAAIRLVAALFAGSGASLKESQEELALPGFLLDMNRFFQHLLSKFLGEFLVGFTIRDEHMLRHMLSYDPVANPRGRRSPMPRPDFAVLFAGRTVSLLDAKYRDLWETVLPREMLYQLTAYALSQPAGFEAAILYPSINEYSLVQRIEIKDPTTARVRAAVALRPVPVARLEQVLSGPLTSSDKQYCRQLARTLALGV